MPAWLGAMVHAEERSYSGSRKCCLVRPGQPGHHLWPIITIHPQYWNRGVRRYISSYSI